MRLLLITVNVGRIFDALDDRLDGFLTLLDDAITEAAADFVAVHLQELGGAHATDIEPIKRFSAAVRGRFPDYWSSGLMCPEIAEADFTALGCIVLARRSVARDVAAFDFGAGVTGGWIPVTTLDDPLVPAPALPVRWCRHNSFTSDPFDVHEPRGWLHTRWRIGRFPLDLLNVHLCGPNQDHLEALRSTAALPSCATRRREQLQRALELLSTSGPPPAALGPLPPSLFVFGDCNFQLDLRQLLSELGGAEALTAARAQADAASAVRVSVAASGAPAVIAPPSTVLDHLAAPCRCLASLALGTRFEELYLSKNSIAMGERLLWRIGQEPAAFRNCDTEGEACDALAPPLCELPVSFPPTCGHTLPGSSTPPLPASPRPACPPYDCGRCPSWSERVLLDAAAMRLLRGASDVSYGICEQTVVCNDHDTLRLAFTLEPLSTLGQQPIPVHVKADVAPQVPLKVKCVAVGAG